MDPTEIDVVRIEYHTGGAWHVLVLPPGGYFDEDPPSEDAIERHAHAVDYLAVRRAEVEVTRLSLCSRGEVVRTVTESFWDEGHSRAIERVGRDPGDWELILDTRIPGNPPLRQIVRLVRIDGRVQPARVSVMAEP